jgi:hypothetical protein
VKVQENGSPARFTAAATTFAAPAKRSWHSRAPQALPENTVLPKDSEPRRDNSPSPTGQLADPDGATRPPGRGLVPDPGRGPAPGTSDLPAPGLRPHPGEARDRARGSDERNALLINATRAAADLVLAAVPD